MVNRIGLFFIFLFFQHAGQAQQARSLQDCESLFQKNNLLLLAAHYQIDEAQAAVIQARILEQPTMNMEFNAVNPQYKRFLDVGQQGQKAAQIQQLIYLGGKKKNEIAWNTGNIALAELNYEDVLRQLLLELRTAYYDIYFNEIKAKRIGEELQHIDTLLKAYQVQERKGNISLKEMVRLQSLSLSLRNNLLNINSAKREQMAKIQLICGLDEPIATAVDDAQLKATLLQQPKIDFNELFMQIQNNNPDYLLKQKELENKERMVRWQKSLNTPDVYVGTSYDQRGGAFGNQINVTLSMSLPFWQKNKGNIMGAEADLKKTEILKNYTERDLRLQVQTLLYQLNEQQALYKSWVEGPNDVHRVYEGILDNFQKRNISLLEFTDFIESYNVRLLSLQELKKQIVQQQQWLNYLANKNLF